MLDGPPPLAAPRLARWLVGRAAAAPDRPFILAELDEEFARRAAESGPRAATRWYRRQAASSIAPLLHARLRQRAESHWTRQARGVVWGRGLGADLRLVRRRWASRPGVPVTAVATLGLGLGATIAIFAVVDAVLLRPPAWREPDRLVAVWLTRPHLRADPARGATWDTGWITWPIFEDLQATRSLEAVGAFGTSSVTLGGEWNEVVGSLQVTSSFMPMLGLRPHLGRFFSPVEDDEDTGVALVSYDAWQRRFGARADILGVQLEIGGRLRTIVGVMPAGFDAVGFGGLAPVFASALAPRTEIVLPFGLVPPRDRTPGNHFLRVVARLRPGVSRDAALADVTPTVRAGEDPAERGARVVPLTEAITARARQPLWLLFAGASLLLLVACSNVAGLLVGQAESRRPEMAVRLALGGSRARLIRPLVIESVLLALAGAGVGLMAASWLAPAFVALAPADLPGSHSVAIDARIALIGVAMSLATAVVFGVGPTLVLAATGPSAALGESGRSLLLRRSRTHDVVIVAEVALASVLLVGASLLAESLLRLTATPVGFDTRDLAVVTVRLPGGGAPVSRDELTARTDRGLERLAALPGVESVAGAATPPFAGSYGSNSIQIEGRAFERDPVANRQVVTEDYFRTMRIPVIEGRTFDVSDRPGANVAIVSTEFARRFLDGEAVGRRFTLNDVAHTIVGVAPNVKYREYTDADAASFYALQRQVGWPSTAFVVRTRGAAGDLLPAIRAAVLENEPGAAVSSIATMEALMRRSVAEERYRALLSSTFGVVALGLAAVGIYGLVTRRVIDRRHEIGLRMALGARPAEVQRLVLANAATLAGIGLAAGIPAAIAAAHVIAGFLYGVEPVSPHTFVLVAAVLGGGAVAAAILPARRASRVDPLVALRE